VIETTLERLMIRALVRLLNNRERTDVHPHDDLMIEFQEELQMEKDAFLSGGKLTTQGPDV
jgi:hypothetical protein